MATDPTLRSNGKALRFAAAIGGAYGAMGVGWILLSDALVLRISADPQWLAAAQRWKGLLYVAATAVALVLLVRYGYRRLREVDEAARQLAQADLERRVSERTADLKRVNEELEAFTRTAAHDLKTPLNGIVGFAELLRIRHGAALGDEGQRMTQRIAESARQMATLVNDLMSLSRASTGELAPGCIDLVPIVREVVDDLQRQEPHRRVTLDLPPQARVWCDGGLARSLVANLVGNAWKFTGHRDEARIALGLDEADGMSVVRLSDNGAGFDALHAQGLFEPFRRFHAASQFGGTGIGLATCRRIVHRHGGRIWIDSTPGEGTVVSFMLPRKD